ncbi:hypothetical protein LTR17_006367 [Elasticomyces elasticus]|nr:hypothetical protein LTR17_006367 [Elasticomyces elasticus]
MDPVSALGIATSCSKAAKTAFDVGEGLYTFIRDSRVVNQSIKALHAEVKAVHTVCELIGAHLKGLDAEVRAMTHLERTRRGRDLLDTLRALGELLAGCTDTLSGLASGTSEMRDDNKTVAAKAVAQFKLNWTKEKAAETRSLLSTHMHALNSWLTILQSPSKQAFLCHNLSVEEIREYLGTLQDQRHDLQLRNQGHTSDIPQNRLLSMTEETIADGETVLGQSIAGGSAVGDEPSDGTSNADPVLSWLSSTTLQTSAREELDFDDGADNLRPNLETRFVIPSMHRTSAPHVDSMRTLGGSSHGPSYTESSTSKAKLPDFAFDSEIAYKSLAMATEAFRMCRFAQAKKMLEETTAMIQRLPASEHRSFDPLHIHAMLAQCAYWLVPSSQAKELILSFLKVEPQDDLHRLDLCSASMKLAIIHVNAHALEQARSSCENALQSYSQLISRENLPYQEALALLTRIHELMGRGTQAKTVWSLIPQVQRECLMSYYRLFPWQEPVSSDARAQRAQTWREILSPQKNTEKLTQLFRKRDCPIGRQHSACSPAG